MLDKIAQTLFTILYEYNPTDNYRVVTFEDIRQKWDGMTNIVQVLEELVDGGYIECKYRDDNNICYICLKKPQIAELTPLEVDKLSMPAVSSQPKKNSTLKLMIGFATNFLGAFLGVVIGLLIFI